MDNENAPKWDIFKTLNPNVSNISQNKISPGLKSAIKLWYVGYIYSSHKLQIYSMGENGLCLFPGYAVLGQHGMTSWLPMPH